MKPIIKEFSRVVLYLGLIVILSFVLPRVIPGSPLFTAGMDTYALNSRLPQETFNAFRDYYAPDRSILEQLGLYLKNLSRLNLGESFYYHMPVLDIIKARIGWTLSLSIISIAFSSLLGIPWGLNTALRKKRFGSPWVTIMMLVQSIPVFVVAVVAQLLFCFQLGLLPSSGAYTPGLEYSAGEIMREVALHSLLPLLVLIAVELPPVFIITHNVCLKTMEEPYVQMARFNNIGPRLFKYRYVLRNSLPEILSKLNIQFLYAISGVIFVEAIFSYPGVGLLLKNAALSRDYPLLQGILLITGVYGLSINCIFNGLIKKTAPRLAANE